MQEHHLFKKGILLVIKSQLNHYESASGHAVMSESTTWYQYKNFPKDYDATLTIAKNFL